jgi:hypothetical protein
MDLLGSILGTMQKPPAMGDAERKKAKGSNVIIYMYIEIDNQFEFVRCARICSAKLLNVKLINGSIVK